MVLLAFIFVWVILTVTNNIKRHINEVQKIDLVCSLDVNLVEINVDTKSIKEEILHTFSNMVENKRERIVELLTYLGDHDDDPGEFLDENPGIHKFIFSP